ncbi:MAG: hypothetical protein JWP29_1358, partial [Rhodoferax sp.]|nr:hypothetical protein [Rhodoferax sp.]
AMPDAAAPPSSTSLTTRMVAAASACAVLVAGGAGLALYNSGVPHAVAKPAGLLLAPMVSVIEPCLLAPAAGSPGATSDLTAACTGPGGSAAQLVESTLTRLQPAGAAAGRYALGYTLPVPLLQLFRATATGWEIDDAIVGRLVRTVRDNPRPLILYLFSTHFAADAPIEEALAKDPANLASTRDGPLPTGRYYDSKIYNWTFASTATDITARRVQAIQAVLAGLCQLEPKDRAKIRGVTLLGELHHLFPDFERGMGFASPYRVSDYGQPSIAAFRHFLRQEFKTVAHLNRFVDSDYASFDAVDPPSRDIRTEPLKRYAEHIDSFAQGSLPVSGWAFVGTAPAWVHIYRDGEFVGKTAVGLGRQDVLKARPEFGDANTGWRLDLDFKRLPPGLHRIDAFLEQKPGELTAIGTRQIAVMDKRQQTPVLVPQKPLPASVPATATLQAYVDQPVAESSYYFNPLVPLWHSFRAQQVAAYLRYFDGVVGASCLADTPRYTHQIVPFTNPSWDANKFAIQTSLQKMGTVRLGVSLYGEASYGSSFANWYGSTVHGGYGVTEFHPLKAMNATALQQVLDRHAAQGAEFLSFFVEPQWHDQLVARGHNIFSFDPENARFGSDRLYAAMQQLLSPAKLGGAAAIATTAATAATTTPATLQGKVSAPASPTP